MSESVPSRRWRNRLIAGVVAVLVIAGAWGLAIALAPPEPPEFDEDWVTWITRKQAEDGFAPNDEASEGLAKAVKTWEQLAIHDWRNNWAGGEPPAGLTPLSIVITNGPWPREDEVALRAADFISQARAMGVFDSIRAWRSVHSTLPMNESDPSISTGAHKASHAVHCAMRIAGSIGDDDEVVECVADLLALGNATAAHRMFNSALLAVGCDARALGELRYFVLEGKLTARSIPTLLQLITEDEHPTVAEIVEGNHRMFLHTQADGRSFADARSHRQYLRESRVWWREFVASAPTTLKDHDWNRTRFEPVFPGSWTAADGMNFFQLEATLCCHQHLLRSIEFNGTACLLAIELFIGNTGRPPSTLDEAADAAGLSAEMRIDVSAGQPFVYRLDPEAPRGYLLYAIGADGVDNGGRFDAPRRAGLAFRPKGHGFDFDLLAPRRELVEDD